MSACSSSTSTSEPSACARRFPSAVQRLYAFRRRTRAHLHRLESIVAGCVALGARQGLRSRTRGADGRRGRGEVGAGRVELDVEGVN